MACSVVCSCNGELFGQPDHLVGDERQGDERVGLAEGAPFANAVGGRRYALGHDGCDLQQKRSWRADERRTVSVDSAAFPDAGTVHDGIQAGVGESLTLDRCIRYLRPDGAGAGRDSGDAIT